MSSEIKFDKFCRGFEFEKYPFNSFTAENELNEQPELFVSTNLYSPLLEAFTSGSTMLLSGDRGTGKTSITYDFVRQAPKSFLICQIDDYKKLKKGFSESEFYSFIIQEMVNAFFLSLPDFKSKNKKLSKDEKVLLTYFYMNFAADATRGLASRSARTIQISRTKKFGLYIYNMVRNPLNVATNVGVSILADVVAQAANTGSEISAKVTEYFPEVAAGIETDFPKSDNTLEALRRFSGLAKKVGFNRIVIIMDKIDEDSRLENAAEEIADFITPILTNNKFLLDESFQIIVSLWVVPLNFIRDKVRTQKVYSPEISWENSDLEQAYNKRVEVFSDTNSPYKFDRTFESEVSEKTRNSILDLSNRNPRDFWHLMNKIFRAQFKLDPKATSISSNAVANGIKDFVCGFNFYEYYPKKANARANSMDVYAYIRHLLRLDNTTFTRNQLNEKAGTGSSTQNYTTGMESLGLIAKETSDKGEARYLIRDPKVRYALENSIEIRKD